MRSNGHAAAVIEDRLPPHALEMEQAALGTLLMDNSGFMEAKDRLQEGAFYDLRHQTIFNSMLSLSLDGAPINTLSLTQRMRDQGQLEGVGGASYIAALPDTAGGPLGYYLDVLHEKSRLRTVLQACHGAIADVYQNEVDVAEIIAKATKAIEAGISETMESFDHHSKATHELINWVEERVKSGGALSGLATGFTDIDQMMDGLQFQELTVVGARPSVGKTAFGIDVMRHLAVETVPPVPVLFVTAEMRPMAIERRLASAMSRVPMNSMKKGKLTDSQMKALSVALGRAAKAPIYYVNAVSGITVSQIASRVKQAVKKHSIKLVIVDYLQKIKPDEKHEKRTYEVAQVSSGLKAIADRTGVAMLALAQLNRENVKDKPRLPRLSDFGDSGQIERDADGAILLHRDLAEKPTEAAAVIAKQKDGETGIVSLGFVGQFCQFVTSTKQQEPPPSYDDD
jgi:replicative DNA helicase